MKNLIALLIISLSLGSLVYGFDASDFSAFGRKYQPVPSGHVPGKDNGTGTGTHNAGEDCGICHRPSGKAPSVVFSISGTLYEDRAGTRPLKGGELILVDINGNVVSMTSNEVGNFWTFAEIGSNPYSVASHSGTTTPLYYTDAEGFHPADPADTRTWQYKAWVKSGSHVRPMVTIAPVGGSTDSASRMSCNMHHAGMGSRGGLWGSNKSALQSYPATGLGFKKHILPIFRKKCAPCHIPGETWTRIVTQSDYEGTTKFDYSKALDLTSYAGSSVTVSGTTWTKSGAGNMASGYQGNPDSSPLLFMTLIQSGESVIHPGGAFWNSADADYKAIRQWIAEGAPDN